MGKTDCWRWHETCSWDLMSRGERHFVHLRSGHASSILRALSVALPIVSCSTAWSQKEAAAAPEPAPEQSMATELERKADGEDLPFRLHRALHGPDWLILGGSQRTRYEGLANQFRPDLDESDQALALRTLFTLGATFGPVSIVGELQDSRAYLTDENSGLSTIVVNAMEPLRAYVNLHLDDVFIDGAALDLRAGRQTMDLGGRRLIARNRFRNTIQNYTGITSHWLTSGRTELFAFGVLPVRVEPGNGDRPGLLDNRIELDRESIELAFWGAFFKQPLGLGVALEAYVFGLNERDGEDFATRNRQLYTPGLRIIGEPKRGEWDVDIESVIQFGSRRSSTDADDTEDHRVLAHFHHASAGYTFGLSWAPRVSAEFDHASGDDPTTGRYERFDSLFGPRRTEFGPTDIYGPLGRENIISAGLRFGAKPHPLLDGYVSWRANWLANARDVFARTGVRDEGGQSGTFAGNQVELRTRLWLLPDSLRWELGGAWFLQGEFMEESPNATGNGAPLFVYTDLELTF